MSTYSRSRGRSRIVDVVLFAVLLTFGLYYLYASADAPVENVRRVIAEAAGDVEAEEIVRKALAEDATPSKWSLAGIEYDVNKALVSKIARDLGETTFVNVEENASSEPESELDQYANKLAFYGIGLYALLLLASEVTRICSSRTAGKRIIRARSRPSACDWTLWFTASRMPAVIEPTRRSRQLARRLSPAVPRLSR